MAKRRLFIMAGIVAAGLFSVCAAFASPSKPVLAVLGQPAPAFDVIDSAGRKRTLAEFAGKPVVLEWTSPSCPFAAAQYESRRMPQLQKWAAAKGVVWLSVLSSHPSRPDYLDAAAAVRFNSTRGGAPTALLIDDDGAMGHAYGALTANHMFVIDRKATLVYAGGIDDAQSTKAPEVLKAHNFVRAALDDVLGGRKVRTVQAEPAGCAISYEGT
ncbi:MAG: redoxin domain-containing protein [Pseudomonadota bacterium]|nr:redoxin domain-containing protein [Pseudomonadota bacterium]